jgi:hypothetical protein
MAATAHLVAKNFAYHIERTTPTGTGNATNRKWRENPRPLVLTDPLSPGTERSFTVRPVRSARLDDVTHKEARISDWFFELEVAYTSNRTLVALVDIMAQDSHDLVKLLRTDDNFTGYSRAQSATDIGLMDREFEGQEFVFQDENVSYLRQAWRCKIKETET